MITLILSLLRLSMPNTGLANSISTAQHLTFMYTSKCFCIFFDGSSFVDQLFFVNLNSFCLRLSAMYSFISFSQKEGQSSSTSVKSQSCLPLTFEPRLLSNRHSLTNLSYFFYPNSLLFSSQVIFYGYPLTLASHFQLH